MKTIYFNNETITANEKMSIILLIREIQRIRITDKKNNIKYCEDEFINAMYGFLDGKFYNDLVLMSLRCFGSYSKITAQIKRMQSQAQLFQV